MASEAKHSPLPWEKRTWATNYVFDATGSLVASVDSEADADLILKAVNTYAALAAPALLDRKESE